MKHNLTTILRTAPIDHTPTIARVGHHSDMLALDAQSRARELGMCMMCVGEPPTRRGDPETSRATDISDILAVHCDWDECPETERNT